MKKIPRIALVPKIEKNMPFFKLGFEWAPDYVGHRHQIGGMPEFLQEKEIPKCKDCHKEMTFYAQLDSLNDEIMIADCGLVYLYICFDCNNTHSFIQSN